jgi:formylglycine-generating enzyme required for sulfatase activity
MTEVVAEKLKVFISYSRRDSREFADELADALNAAGFAPFLDRNDIAPGEDFQARLEGMIQEADTVIYVISPESVASVHCIWEVERSLSLSKRLFPVVFQAVPDKDIPEILQKLQFVRFDNDAGFARPLRQLTEALRQDIVWIREHTRIGERAARWNSRERATSLLLRGDELGAARNWIANRLPDAPAITEIQRNYLDASEIADRREREELHRARQHRQRMRAIAVALFLTTVGGVSLAIWSNRPFFNAAASRATDRWWSQVLSEQAERNLRPGEVFRECIDCPYMVVIPSGEFSMGSGAIVRSPYVHEFPPHKVSVSRAFAVSQYEVTFAQWDSCVHHRVCPEAASDEGWGRASRPVINVSWNGAKVYVEWLSTRTGKMYRLLSEAEWEYAARAGSKTTYSWGADLGKGNANCVGCGSEWDAKSTAPVGSFRPNQFGLFDMHGNELEWVEDCRDLYKPEDRNAGARQSGDCDNRILRGGSWVDHPTAIRSTARLAYPRTTWGRIVGFRVARTLAGH